MTIAIFYYQVLHVYLSNFNFLIEIVIALYLFACFFYPSLCIGIVLLLTKDDFTNSNNDKANIDHFGKRQGQKCP